MNKLVNILIYIFTLFLIEAPIWNNNQIINYILFGLMLIIDIIIIIKTPKRKIKLDRIDLLLISVPLIYIIHTILGLNKLSLFHNYMIIIPELILVLTILIIRRYINKKHINIILDGLVYGSIFYFLASLFATNGVLSFLGINSIFTDTYVTSIDRMYGTLLYCNASALFSLIAFFICFYKSKQKEDKYFYKIIMFMNLISISYTFSKIETLIMILMFIVLITYYLIRKNYTEIKRIVTELTSMFLPLLISITALRTYLINNNIKVFVLTLIISISLYMILNLIIDVVSNKKMYIYIPLILILNIPIVYLYIKPISIPLEINSVSKENEYYITDIIFTPNTKNTIEVDYEGKGNISFHLEGLVELGNQIGGINVGELKDNKIEFTAQDIEYYLLKVNGLNKDTDIKINKVLVNGKEYLINSFLIPYSLVHQKDLINYDKESASHRLLYYNDCLKYSKENYFLYGGGKGTFEYKRLNETNREYLEINPHSYLFELIIDIGILGAFYLFFIYAIGIKNMLKKWKREEYLVIFTIFSCMSIGIMFDPIMSQIVFKGIYLIIFVLLNDLGKNRFKELRRAN